jgi:hypothetical protein
MYHPVHIDGRSVVVLRKRGLGYLVVRSGWLEFDGTELTLTTEDGRIPFSDEENNGLKRVVADNRIPQCRGFDFFLIE